MARPIAKDYDEKRGHILKEAARVFAEQGVARASMSEVARACGISKANIYHYYPGKDALLFDILDSYLSALMGRVLAVQVTGAGTAQDQLGLLTAEILRAYEGMDHEHKIQTEGIALLPDAQQAVLKSYQRKMVAHMGTLISRIAPHRFADAPDHLRAVVMSVFGMLNWFYMWNAHADRAARDDYARLVTDMVLHGITGPAA